MHWCPVFQDEANECDAPLSPMASGVHVDQALAHIKQRIQELCEEFKANDEAINDDSTTLNKFCSELELVLQHGQKDKTFLLNVSKGYWGYFCRCLAGEKSLKGFSALKYAKSLPEIKTHVGRGRAVIRYCLVHQCLADTLQVCTLDEKATSDHYYAWSLVRQPEKLQALLSSLYELNAVPFDLAPSGNDLDASWPIFARKVFDESWPALSRCSSLSSLSSINSAHSQLDTACATSPVEEGPTMDSSLVAQDGSPRPSASAEDSVMETPCRSDLQPVVRTFKSRSLSPVVFKISPPDVCRAAPFLVVKTASSQTECCLPDRVAEAEATATACSEKLEKMAEEWRAKEQAWLEKEALMQGELESLRASQPGETACVQSSCKSCDDLKEVVQRLSVEKDDLTTKNNFLARKLNEVLEKLEDSEETINTLKQSETELRTRIEKLSFVNEGLKNLVDAVKDEATILRQQILIMDKEVKSSHELLEQKKMQCKGLEDQLVKLRSKCCESINASAVKDREIEKLASLVRLARRRLFSKTPAMHQSDASLEESSKISPDNSMSDEALLKMLSSEEMEESGIPAKQTSRTESSNCELFEHCLRYLGSAMLHHESLIDRANAKVRDIISTSHSINLQLHVMQEVLSMQHAKEDGGSAEGDISVTKEVTGPSEELVPPRIEGCDFVTSLFETMCRNHSKMQSLMQSESHLEKELADCRELNRLLSSKVHEQERKLCGFVQELDRTKILLVGMEQTHHKLQTAKAVMRYELQEKKNLLHNLRQQLESTRENCVKVMRSNAESEIEWKSLREEFQSRKKQDSQDSGVSDNGQSTREQTPSSSEDCSERDDPESAEDDDHSDSVEDIPEEGAQFIPEQVADFECKYRARSQRLEYLEQQCQILYNSLVRSSERRNNLQRRLHSLLEGGGTSSSETVVQPVLSDSAPSIPVEPDDSGSREGVVDEEDCDAASDDVSFCEEDSDEVMDGALPEIRKKTLDTIVGRVKLERSQSEEVISNLRATIEQLQTANERLRQQVSNLVEEKAQREKEMRQRASGMLRTERSLKCVQMQEISRERGELLLRNKELEQQLEQKDMQITRIDASRLQSIEKQQMLEKELGTLTEKLQDQAASNSRLYTEMRERLEDQERMIEELEQCVEDLKQDQVIEQTNFAEEVKKLQLGLVSREEECSILSDELKRLRVQADVDKECGERLKQQLDQSSAQVASCEEQLSQLRMDTVELKKKIVKLVREKDILWKQNDNLQFLQKLQATDKWMDNSETDSCLQCSAPFTFTLRKHHCRLCGRIYCHDCCSNWLMTTASSRPTRVCNACAFQHQQLERAARNPSVCSNASADSEEDDIGVLAMRRREEPAEATDTIDSSNSTPDEAVSSSAPIQGTAPRTEALKMTRNWSFPRLRRPQFLQSGASSLTESDSCAKQEFDIISDEEIARSLLACSPYNSSPKTSHDPALFHMSGPRTMDEIAQCGPAGLRGEVWVNAGGRYSIPVQLAVPKTVLFWEFRCEPKSISFEMRYKPLNSDAELEMMDVILSMVRVQADVQPAEGSLLVKNAGVYVLVFDNQHSKFMAKKVSYKLHLDKPCASDGEASSV
ncbi:uncharacterized protein LOC144093924 isoform X2 [Amblyomma americanum]